MDYNKIMQEIIEYRYKYMKLDVKDTSSIFWKLAEFEANSVGYIGEAFLKDVLKNEGVEMVDEGTTVHDEYDILLKDGTKIEIKTARKGSSNNTYQFNGVNPAYNYDYIFCFGLTTENMSFRIIDKKQDIKYFHKDRSHFVKIDSKQKKLVRMNPGNDVNRKITLNSSEMFPIEALSEAIGRLNFVNK